MKTIQQRNEYIQSKMKQHDAIKGDVFKYQKRLKRIIRYHSLLTVLEVKQVRENIRNAFK